MNDNVTILSLAIEIVEFQQLVLENVVLKIGFFLIRAGCVEIVFERIARLFVEL